MLAILDIWTPIAGGLAAKRSEQEGHPARRLLQRTYHPDQARGVEESIASDRGWS
jgi:hypothetical protein